MRWADGLITRPMILCLSTFPTVEPTPKYWNLFKSLVSQVVCHSHGKLIQAPQFSLIMPFDHCFVNKSYIDLLQLTTLIAVKWNITASDHLLRVWLACYTIREHSWLEEQQPNNGLGALWFTKKTQSKVIAVSLGAQWHHHEPRWPGQTFNPGGVAQSLTLSLFPFLGHWCPCCGQRTVLTLLGTQWPSVNIR